MKTLSQIGIQCVTDGNYGILMPYRNWYETTEEYAVKCAKFRDAKTDEERERIKAESRDVMFKRMLDPSTPIPKCERWENESLKEFKLREMKHIEDYKEIRARAHE